MAFHNADLLELRLLDFFVRLFLHFRISKESMPFSMRVCVYSTKPILVMKEEKKGSMFSILLISAHFFFYPIFYRR